MYTKSSITHNELKVTFFRYLTTLTIDFISQYLFQIVNFHSRLKTNKSEKRSSKNTLRWKWNRNFFIYFLELENWDRDLHIFYSTQGIIKYFSFLYSLVSIYEGNYFVCDQKIQANYSEVLIFFLYFYLQIAHTKNYIPKNFFHFVWVVFLYLSTSPLNDWKETEAPKKNKYERVVCCRYRIYNIRWCERVSDAYIRQ